MNKEHRNTTETQILDAAKVVFHRAGFTGARMQEIADEAGINKALLHYYYRSKSKLFEAVFQEAMKKNFLPVVHVLSTDRPLEEKIPLFVEGYIDQLIRHPYVPAFVLHELNRNPAYLVDFFRSMKVSFSPVLAEQIQKGIDEGRYREVDPKQMIASLVGMVIFPFIARPMLKMVFQLSDDDYVVFLKERKMEITKSFFTMIRK